jgi:hypothetical protein
MNMNGMGMPNIGELMIDPFADVPELLSEAAIN